MSIKRILAVFLLTVIIIQPGMNVLAHVEIPEENAAGEEVEKTPEEIAAEEEAKKKAAYDTAVDSNALAGWPVGPQVYAASAIVMDMESGAVLYAKKTEDQHFPASITKLLTTLVALEEGDLSDTITFTENSINFLEYDDANIGMKVGEQISMNDALYAVLLASANEVSYAVAESTGVKMGGSYETFIQRMNDRAEELGCTGSHWMNPHGLHDDAHYTTVHDMARIASAVYQREEFRNIMGSLEYKIGATNLVEEERIFQQNHKMLWPDNYYYYEPCKGGKTGYTDQSGTTLVTMADNGAMHLAAVVMVDYGVTAYDDTRAMLDYVFGNFTKVPLIEQQMPEDIESLVDQEAYVVLPAGIDFSQLEYEITAHALENAPSEENRPEFGNQVESQNPENVNLPANIDSADARIGTVMYQYQGQEVGHTDVVLSRLYFEKLEEAAQEQEEQSAEVPEEVKEPEEPDPEEIEEKEKIAIPYWVFPAAGAVVVISAVSAHFIIHYKRIKNRRKSKRSRIEEK